MGFKLFTGTVGYIKSKEDIRDNCVILIGNIIGASGILAFPPGTAVTTMTTKLASPLMLTLIEGIICGIFIYSAVACFRKQKDYMVPVCVIGFITSGGEHCIANLCYAIAARNLSFDVILFLIVVAIGNIIGALVIDRLQ